MIGTILGRYRIVAKLGEGGMGTVWRADDPTLGRTVALKLLSPALWASEAARERFHREARAASKLDHRSIATVFDVGETEGVAWIAYKFIDGETVAARTTDKPLPVPEAVSVARDIAEALAHAHSHGVLHRDVTAGNVMITRDGRGVLVDFGLALPDRGIHVTSTGNVVGTAGYLAPEVLRGGLADERSDLYGLGAVLYRMLTGRLPFDGGPPESLLYKVLNEPIAPPSELRPEIAPAVERVVMKLLQREPADRLASAPEAEEALAEAARAQGPSAADVRWRAITKRWRHASATIKRIGRVRVGLTAIVAVALIAAGMWHAAKRGWLPGTAHGPQVLAVLPFENTSADPDEVGYLAEGLGDELVSRLGKSSGMRVIPWLTSRRQSDAKHSLPEIAKTLHADALLVGSFRADNERLRVTASLVDGKSGLQRWSQTFDQTLTDLLTVQTNLALQVATQLQGSLVPAERVALSRQPTTNAEAYTFYLQGVTYLQSDDYNTRGLAQPFFERALKLDSTLAEAHVGRGAALLDQHFRGTSGGIDALLSADGDFVEALRLDSTLIQAQRARVQVVIELGRPEEALRIASRVAKRGDWDLEGLLTRGRACMLSGFAAYAVPLYDRALAIDPGNQEAAWYRTISFAWSGNAAGCLDAGKAYIRKYGEDPEIYLWMSNSAGWLSREAERDLYMNRSLELFGDESSDLYSVSWALASRLDQDTSSASRLLTHWIPILRSRLELAPDNYRVLTTLIGLEGYAGDESAMRGHLDQYYGDLRSRPAEANATGFEWVIPGLAYIGNTRELDRAIQLARQSDLANLQGIAIDQMTRSACPPKAVLFLKNLATFRSLRADIRRRLEDLGRRYLPAVALEDGRGRS